jgi:enamine deaminase RidA (YjgF/YER057c/UK114 family)
VVSCGVKVVDAAGQGGENQHGALQLNFRFQVRQALENVRVALAAVGAAPGAMAG